MKEEFSNDLFFSTKWGTYSIRKLILHGFSIYTQVLINGLKSSCWEILSDHYDLFFSRFLHKFLLCSALLTLNTASRTNSSLRALLPIEFLILAPLLPAYSLLIRTQISDIVLKNGGKLSITRSFLTPYISTYGLGHLFEHMLVALSNQFLNWSIKALPAHYCSTCCASSK